jgi:hypothetical protein
MGILAIKSEILIISVTVTIASKASAMLLLDVHEIVSIGKYQ